jgi:AraC-like DNA-binding protein
MELEMARQDTWNDVTYRVIGNNAAIELVDAVYRKHQYSWHSHAELVIGVTTAGGGHYSTPRGSEVARPGQLIVFNPQQPHAGGTVSSASWHYRAIHFDVAALAELLETRLGIRASISLKANGSTDSQLAAGFLATFDSLSKASTVLLDEEVILDFLRSVFARLGSEKARTACNVKHDDVRLHTVVEYMHAHFNINICLRDMAILAQCEDYHLVRLFRHAFGFTPHAYVVQLRLNEACRLLRHTQLPYAEIASDVGFCDQGHLIRRFKRAYGITPSLYRAAVNARTQVCMAGRDLSPNFAQPQVEPVRHLDRPSLVLQQAMARTGASRPGLLCKIGDDSIGASSPTLGT